MQGSGGAATGGARRAHEARRGSAPVSRAALGLESVAGFVSHSDSATAPFLGVFTRFSNQAGSPVVRGTPSPLGGCGRKMLVSGPRRAPGGRGARQEVARPPRAGAASREGAESSPCEQPRGTRRAVWHVSWAPSAHAGGASPRASARPRPASRSVLSPLRKPGRRGKLYIIISTDSSHVILCSREGAGGEGLCRALGIYPVT